VWRPRASARGRFLFSGDGLVKTLSRDGWAVIAALVAAVLVRVGAIGHVPW
jgi:hypothetical protein